MGLVILPDIYLRIVIVELLVHFNRRYIVAMVEDRTLKALHAGRWPVAGFSLRRGRALTKDLSMMDSNSL